MSSNSFQKRYQQTSRLENYIYIYIYKQDLVLNDPQILICYKTQQNRQITKHTRAHTHTHTHISL